MSLGVYQILQKLWFFAGFDMAVGVTFLESPSNMQCIWLSLCD